MLGDTKHVFIATNGFKGERIGKWDFVVISIISRILLGGIVWDFQFSKNGLDFHSTPRFTSDGSILGSWAKIFMECFVFPLLKGEKAGVFFF